MKIQQMESLHADAGWRTFDFLKVTTDDGLVGWSEYNESFGGMGVAAAIDQLSAVLIGKDPRAYEAHVALMQALRRTSSSGTSQQAIGAIENALLDVKARALGIPVYELLGGPVRNRIRVYWSHFGTYRVRNADPMGVPPVRTMDDLLLAGQDVVARGYSALKTNLLLLDRPNPSVHTPGFARGDSFPELNPERYVLDAIRASLSALREHLGPDIDILVDLNFNFKTEGFLKVARAMEPYDLFWVEIDTRDPQALRYHPRPHDHPGGNRGNPLPPPRVPPVPGAGRGRRDDCGHPLQRPGGIPQDGCHVRRLRGQRGPAQLLQPPGDHDERRLLRRGAKPPNHGVRRGRRALAR